MIDLKKYIVLTLLSVVLILVSLAVWKHLSARQLVVTSKLPETVSVTETPMSSSVTKSATSSRKKRELLRTQSTFDNATSFRNTTSIDTDVDVAKVQQSSIALVSGTEDEQIDAIKLFSKIGTEEQKTIIEGYAKDPDKSIAIRLAAIEYIDFDKNVGFLSNIIQGDNGIAEATLYMASDMELSLETQEQFNESAYSAFQKTSRPSTQIAILNYFFEQHDARFDELSGKVSLDEYSPEEKEDVLRLINQRKEEVKPIIDTD